MWREINRYRIVNDDGSTEEMILERNTKGTFRIRNDFGNVSIEFDSMSGIEFLRKAFADVQDEVEIDLNDLWDDLDDDTEADCDGQPY